MTSLDYQYTLASTESTTGYFSCEPPALSFADALALLERTPNDEFLHRHLLRRILDGASCAPSDLAAKGQRPVLDALCAEAALLQEHAGQKTAFLALETYPVACQESLRAATPLPYLDWAHAHSTPEAQEEQQANETWNALFNANLTQHHALPHPDDGVAPIPAAVRDALRHEKQHRDAANAGTDRPRIADVQARLIAFPGASWSRPPAHETAARALANLASAGVIAGIEMRHEASLSPIGLLRHWHVAMDVHSGALDYTLRGEATTWGRGLSVAEARASYAMEMVERASAYLSIVADRVVGLAPHTDGLLIKARRSELLAQGRNALDPDVLPVALPYRDQALYWIQGHSAPDSAGEKPGSAAILVPVQAVGLFCNLDEPTLFLSPGSTGLASGNTLEEAKVAALTELLERDAEATVPWHRSRCFALLPPAQGGPQASADPHTVPLAALLADYAARGIQLRFMDMTTEFGLPCYQCFVRHPDGTLARGTGAGLSAQRAILSALTETPYPYPHGPASLPALDVPSRCFDTLPDYRLESPSRNLTLLETVLTAHGRPPVYVELTRSDLAFPVVRALVPGLELTADYDRFTRPPARLFARYLHGVA